MMGTRGIPAIHGGFEACVENVAPFLASRHYDTYVFRQLSGSAEPLEAYRNVSLINIKVKDESTLSTIIFDIKSTMYVINNFKKGDLVVTFGYPTAFLFPVLRIFGFANIVNMDGIEWKRNQFGIIGKVWYWLNEKIAVLTASTLIADHPRIAKHLEGINVLKKAVHVIAYSADDIRDINVDPRQLSWRVNDEISDTAFTLIMARLEPDNQILEIISAFSREPRGYKLVVAGRLDTERNKYHAALVKKASHEVVFLGGVYRSEDKIYLRNNALAYIHGHTVGGTNPSLVEALGSRSPIIAHDNMFNRGVADKGAVYFKDEKALVKIFDKLLKSDLTINRSAANEVFKDYTHQVINSKYLDLIKQHVQ